MITLGVYLGLTKVPGLTFSSAVNLSDKIDINIACDGSTSAQVVTFMYKSGTRKDVTFTVTSVNMNDIDTVSVYLESDNAEDIDVLNGINTGIKSVISELVV